MVTWEVLRPHGSLLARLISHAPAMGVVAVTAGGALLWVSQAGDGHVPDPGPVWMAFNLAVLASAVMMLCCWYFLGDASAAWSAACLLCVGVYVLPLLAVDATTWSTPLSVVDLAAMATIGWMARAAANGTVPTGRWHPVVGGLGIGLILAGARAVIHVAVPELQGWPTYVAVAVGFPIAAALIGSAVLSEERSRRARPWLLTVVAMLGFFCFHVLPNAPLPAPLVDLGIVAMIATCVLLVTISSRLLHEAYFAHDRQLVALSDRASAAEASHRRDEDILHEFRATIAGVEAAIRLLLTSSNKLPADQRESLQRMLDAELTRLRVMAAADTAQTDDIAVVELDQIIEPVVIAHRVQGAQIEMPTTGISARCGPLEVATAMNVLLHNARQHAAGARIWVEWEQHRGATTVRVRDDGPGVPAEVRDILFGRCAKGRGSPGHGLGLFSARQAIVNQGGELTLEPTTRGASFALVLPR